MRESRASGSKNEVAWEPPGRAAGRAEGAGRSSGTLRIVSRKQSVAVMAILGVLLIALNALAYYALCFNPMTGGLRMALNVPGWFLAFWIGIDVSLGSYLLHNSAKPGGFTATADRR